MKILITGSQGFIGSYLCNEFLSNGYDVIGVDNYSKYGKIKRYHDDNVRFKFYELNICNSYDFDAVCEIENPQIIIACAAMIGGVSYYNKFAYDLMATNERILASTFDSSIKLFQKDILKRIIVFSSSMVYENTEKYPTPENEISKISVPLNIYGFQKLSCEYFAKAAWQQYKLPYTIVRPFNIVGIGEDKSLDMDDTNENMMLSHVLPDLINKILTSKSPVNILGSGQQIRCFTNGKDFAKAIRLICENEKAILEDFNISTSQSINIIQLAKIIWNKINTDEEFAYNLIPGFDNDVQISIPDVSKAKNILKFETEISLEQSIDEVIEYIKRKK